MYNNYSSYASVTNMLQTLNWPPLAHYGHQLNVITMFKIMHQLIDALTDTILIYLACPNQLLFMRSLNQAAIQPNTRTDSYLNSSFHQV